MKPRSKSVWILPAACGAFVPLRDRPRAALVRARGQEGNQAQQVSSTRAIRRSRPLLPMPSLFEEHASSLRRPSARYLLRSSQQMTSTSASSPAAMASARPCTPGMLSSSLPRSSSLDVGRRRSPAWWSAGDRLTRNFALLVRHRAGARGLPVCPDAPASFSRSCSFVGKALFAALEHLHGALGTLGHRLDDRPAISSRLIVSMSRCGFDGCPRDE